MKTVRVICNIQEDSIGYNKIKQLESIITSSYQTHFGDDYKLRFFWLSIPYGQSYLAGKVSTASTVQIPVEDGMPDDKRHPFMSEVCAKWMQITHCSKDEIILASSDMTQAKAFLDSMNSRFKKSKSMKTQVKIILSMIGGRVMKGYFNTSVNL